MGKFARIDQRKQPVLKSHCIEREWDENVHEVKIGSMESTHLLNFTVQCQWPAFASVKKYGKEYTKILPMAYKV